MLSPTGVALECVGRQAENPMFADYFMTIDEIELETCPAEAIVGQVLQVFSEETQEHSGGRFATCQVGSGGPSASQVCRVDGLGSGGSSKR